MDDLEKNMIARAHNKASADGELMSAVARGDMEPLGEIYKRYGGTVRTLIWRLLPLESSFDAEDICHDVFMTVYQIAGKFDPNCELRPWLFGIAVRKARGWCRKKWLREKLLRARANETLPVQSKPAVTGETPMHYEIDRAIKSLPPAQSEVLILHVTCSMNGEQIARTLGVPVNTVWTRLRRARLAVRAALENECKREIGGPQ